MTAVSLRRTNALTLVVALLLVGCGPQQRDESGAVSAETVKQLEDVMQARAAAMAKGDRDGFLKTIDTTRPAFRRIQLREFDLPSARGTLASTFKLSNVERYMGYVRGFVEETLEGNALPGSFNGGRAYYRHYFRTEDGKWILTEPTGGETGVEKTKTSGNVEVGYWAMDEDVSGVLLSALESARTYALAQSPKPLPLAIRISFVPTAELAGPNWDGFNAGAGVTGNTRLFPWWWAFDGTRTGVSGYVQFHLRRLALDVVRDTLAPRVESRLISDGWLNAGWLNHVAGLDVSSIVRQSCAGVPVLTLRELRAGYPPFGQPGVAPETYGRFEGYASSMVAYLYEKYGADSYWRLMSAYLLSASAATNFPNVLQITQEDFYAAWLVWLKKKYC